MKKNEGSNFSSAEAATVNEVPQGYLKFRSTLFLPPALQNKNNLVKKDELDKYIVEAVVTTLQKMLVPDQHYQWIEKKIISDLQTLNSQVLSNRSAESFVEEMLKYYCVGVLRYVNTPPTPLQTPGP